MSDDSLIQAMPDLVAFVRPDGLITHHLGGRQVPFARSRGSLAGKRLGEVLQAEVAALIARLVRRALSSRGGCEADFSVDGATYHARLSAQGSQRALCVIRHVSAGADDAQAADSGTAAAGAERRGFVRRFQASVAEAAMRERPLALCMIFLDGLTDISRQIDFSIGERILTEVLRRLPPLADAAADASGYVGPLGEGLLGIVIEGNVDRDHIRARVGSLLDSIGQPIAVGDATFHLATSAGVAVLGQDASQPAALLDHARAAMLEARRTAAGPVQFYSDTLRMLPVARLDIEFELRKAIADGQIGMHYVARHDLASGRIAGIQAYVRWSHPLRGEVAPSEFLAIADATGLALPVSRAALERLAQDLPALRDQHGEAMPFSFGALRQHVASGRLVRDCRQSLPSEEFTSGRLELRIAERTLATLNRPDRALGEMAESGISVVVDELGRGFSSLARLPQLPLYAVQIDRALVVAAGRSSAARRSCRAIAAMANALEILPIATGVDDEAARARMVEIGCAQGIGDHYPHDLAAVSARDSRKTAARA